MNIFLYLNFFSMKSVIMSKFDTFTFLTIHQTNYVVETKKTKSPD